MTTSFDFRVWWSKWWKFVIGFVSALVLYYLIQVIFFSDKKDEPSGRNYKNEFEQSQKEIDRLRSDSLKLRQDLRNEVAESEEEALEYKIKFRQLERHYEKLNFKTHTFDELDSIRDRTLSDINKE